MDNRKAAYGLGLMAWGLLKVLVGCFLIWGQYAFQEPGTAYGFLWPHNLHDFLADVRTVNILLLAVWLIRNGIWGVSPEQR